MVVARTADPLPNRPNAHARLSAFADVRRSRDARLPPPVCCPSPCSACGRASGRRDSHPYVALESDGIA
ncbi:conserved hypothetical protein [Ricinus communis]|uniref:Uncharacterized protein n=1 Tax=Ricinus communis TaxID=3988 RepID=B9TDI9_RICCO|nr:conserved hypothetical protein [Ricinus communis]